VARIGEVQGEYAVKLPPGRLARFCLRAHPWPFILLALSLSAAYCWVYRTPAVAMVALNYFGDFCMGSFLFTLIAAGRRIQLQVRNQCEIHLNVRHKMFRSRHWFWPWLLVISVGTFWLVRSELPMRLAFLVSRPALDHMADEALADPANAHRLAGRWAGLYQVAGVEVIGKTVVVYVGTDRGSYGFIRAPGAPADLINNGAQGIVGYETFSGFPPGQRSNDLAGRRMEGDWFVMYSWYLLVKDGWSETGPAAPPSTQLAQFLPEPGDELLAGRPVYPPAIEIQVAQLVEVRRFYHGLRPLLAHVAELEIQAT
jgi:hypothetical protein